MTWRTRRSRFRPTAGGCDVDGPSRVVRGSDHTTIRIIVFRAGPLSGDLARAMEPFAALGVYAEGASQYGMVALDIEPGDPLPGVVAVLRRGVVDGSWEYEVGRITDAWVAATAG